MNHWIWHCKPWIMNLSNKSRSKRFPIIIRIIRIVVHDSENRIFKLMLQVHSFISALYWTVIVNHSWSRRIACTVYQKLRVQWQNSMTELNDRIKVNQKAFITQVNLLISFKTSKWWILKPQVTCLLLKLTWYATCAGHKRSEQFFKNLKTINIASYNLRPDQLVTGLE